MKPRMIVWASWIVAALLWSTQTSSPAAPQPAALSSCCAPGDADFPKVGGNLGNQNYSSLRAINRRNVRRLGAVWMSRLQGGVVTSADSQSTAVAVDGVLYIETALGAVVAVDGATGATRWTYPGKGVQTRRGVAVGQGLVFTNARGGWVVALDAETGEVVWERQPDPAFGNVGKVAVVYHGGRIYVGTADGPRGAGIAMDAATGDVLWTFFGIPEAGQPGSDTWEGESWRSGGGAPWMHPAIDPELNLVYWTFGNARGSRSSQDGSERGGANLFTNSIVAMDAGTGAYRWHFQSIHHGIWDMDNVMAPVLADIRIGRRNRKAVIYGSKTGMYYILDRTDGRPLLGIDEVPVPQEPRQKTWPTQPYPRQGGWTERCVVDQPLGTAIPGNPNRAVPNFVRGCLFDPHWDIPILSIPGHGGGADWNHQSFSPRTGLAYTGFGYVAAAHDLVESANGLRPIGEYQTGGIVAVDVSTNRVRWKKQMPYELAHGNGILTTRSDLLFIGMPDGNLLAMDAWTGRELWRFQTGAAISSSPITYEVNGEQYVAVYAGGTGIPYGSSVPRGDYLWAFKLGGAVAQLPAPAPPVVRRPVAAAPVEGSTVANTVLLARNSDRADAPPDQITTNAMFPQHLRVPVGTTVTFLNPVGNLKPHCATQFFEGLFNPTLAPGESFTYTFDRVGEYFYNDCTDPRPTGKVVVY